MPKRLLYEVALLAAALLLGSCDRPRSTEEVAEDVADDTARQTARSVATEVAADRYSEIDQRLDQVEETQRHLLKTEKLLF